MERSAECCPGTLCLLWGVCCLPMILLGQFWGEDMVLSIPSQAGNLLWPWQVCWGHHIHLLDPTGDIGFILTGHGRLSEDLSLI